ncbi:MAG: cupin domain-containing protein [bacterium]
MIRHQGTGKVEVRDQMRGGPGRVTIEHLWQPAEVTAKTRLFARLTLAPGAGIGFHEHVGEDEVYVILRGSGVVTDGGVRTPVTVGDSILTGNGAGHAIEAVGTEPLELLAVIMTY